MLEKRKIKEYEELETVALTCNEEYVSDTCQWVVDDNSFFSIGKTIQQLPPGFYSYIFDHSINKIRLTRIKVITDNILTLPDPVLNNILLDFQKFWENRERYQKYEFVYKRTYLMYGPPGCGKTSLIALLSKELIKRNGVILNINTVDQIELYDRVIKDIRDIEKEKPLIVIIEDIDGYTEFGNISRLLNILDGTYQTDNVIIIATTNYPERLEERFSSRPSRFDVRVLIDVPSPEVREFYIKSKLKPEDLARIDINEWIRNTEGFTLDHLKELILLTFVLDNPFDDSLIQVKEMIKNVKIKNVTIKRGLPTPVGFSNQNEKIKQ